MTDPTDTVKDDMLRDELLARTMDFMSCAIYQGNRGKLKDLKYLREKLAEAVYFCVEWKHGE